MSKALLFLLMITSLTLGACGQLTASATNYDTGITTTSQSAKLYNPAVEEAAVNKDDPTILDPASVKPIEVLVQPLTWNNFAIEKLSADIEADELQLTLIWTNRINDSVKFAELAKIQTFQNGDELIMIEHDDQLNNPLQTEAKERAHIVYHLNDTIHDIEIKIAAHNGDDAQIINLNLQS